MILKQFALLSLVFLCVACSGGGGTSISESISTTNVADLRARVITADPSYLTKNGETPVNTVLFRVKVLITDRRGSANWSRISVENSRTNRFWDLLGGPDGLGEDFCFNATSRYFDCEFRSPAELHSLDLTGWQLVITTRDGFTITEDFVFTAPDGLEPFDEEFVYSEQYTGSTTNGTPGIEVLTVADSGLSIVSNVGTQSYAIAFEVTDATATEYKIDFYDGEAIPRKIASAEFNAPSIVSTPIVVGVPVNLSLPWSEISFVENEELGLPDTVELTVDDIESMHVVLLSDQSVTGDDLAWFNQTSISELVEL